MTVSRIGLCTTTTGWYNTDEIKVSSSTSYSDLYIGFCTDFEHDSNDKVKIAVRYRGIGKSSPSVLPNWSSWQTITKSFADCNIHYNSYYGDYWHAVSLKEFSGLLSKLQSGNTFNMSGRKYDYMEFDISITVILNYTPEWNNYSNTMAAEYGSGCITYVPDYQIETMVNGSLNEIKFTTNHPDGWRSDDRFSFTILRQYPRGSNILNGEVWGTVDGNGDLWLSRYDLTNEPVDGTTYVVNCRMNRNWMPIGNNLITISTRVTYDASPQCNTPTCTVVSSTIDELVVRIGDSGDKNHAIERVRITLEGSSYKSDTSAGDLGLHTLPAQPFGTNTYEIHGWNDDYGISDSIYITATTKADGNYCYFSTTQDNDNDDLINCRIQYNPQYSISVEPQKEIFKFAGRSNPTVFNGVGTSTSVSISGDLIDDDAATWLAIARANRRVIVRFPDGKRFLTSVDNMDVNWDYRPIKSVSFAGTEVE